MGFLMMIIAFAAAGFGVVRLTAVTSMVEDCERKVNNLNDSLKYHQDLVQRDLNALRGIQSGGQN